MSKAKVWIAEPIPCTDVAVSKLIPHAEVGISPAFYEDIPAERLNGLDAVIVADSFLTERSLLGADRLRNYFI